MNARGPASAASSYQSGVREFNEYREKVALNLSHERHSPRLYGHGKSTDYAVVLMHGLFESPFYLKGLAREFHASGKNVVLPLLAKHWERVTTSIDFADFHEWIDDYMRSVELAHKLGKKVILAGHSTGGLLAIYAAMERPDLVDGLILWSPALSLSTKAAAAAYIGNGLTGHIGVVNVNLSLNFNLIAGKPDVRVGKVAYYSPKAALQVKALGEYLISEFARKHPEAAEPKRALFESIHVPVFLVGPEHDDIVSQSDLDHFYKSVQGPKEYLRLSGENHISTPKAEGDFVTGAQMPNKKFAEMAAHLRRFLDKNFPY